MATVSAWAKPGAWALDSEQQEEEDLQKAAGMPSPAVAEVADFPSLAVAATTKPSKKKKAQALSLAEFTTGKQVTHGAAKGQTRSVGLTPDELLALPTGPRERSAEELERGRLGGGFRNYGGGPRDFERRGGGFNGSDESGTTRWGSGRVSDEPRRNGGFGRDSAPSRADEVEDWGAGKKLSPAPSFERRERGGFFDSHSKADEADSWVSNKGPVPSEPRRERRGGFEMFNKESSNGSDSSDTWGRKKESFGAADSADTWGRKREEPAGRPRLVLQPRSVPMNDGEANAVPASGRGKGSSPFGEARPREEVLAEKGQDWKKIDEQLESMKIKETGDGASIGKRGLGVGNGKANGHDDRIERNWRKSDDADVTLRAEAETAAEEVAAN